VSAHDTPNVTAANPPPAPWIADQLKALLAQRGHAWLLSGPSGLGQYRLGFEMVRAWLCEQPTPNGACGQCNSCHAIDVRTHADLCVLMPETVMIELGWPLSEKAQSDIDDKKRKASKEIRVDAMRDAIEFSQRTSARGRGKAVLVFPAERMNHITANALLKTLEEPPGDVKFVLATESAHQLLPTIRSRCLGHTMQWPAPEAAQRWLQAQGLQAEVAKTLLRATGSRPDDAAAFMASGRDPASWALLPKAMQRGELSLLKDWTPAQTIDALHKLCHDLMAQRAGAAPRFFDASNLPSSNANAAHSPSLSTLSQWSKDLSKATRTMEHPFNAGLMLEALVSQAKNTLNSRV
jgi:DNA polymerase III subunit delta'